MIWLLALIIITQIVCTDLLRFSMDFVSPIFELRALGLFLVFFIGWILSGKEEKELL
tara:strand:+ start:15 stop:185 length:171 start_codon:yes stop_codon:yes gene_type:complete